MIFILGFLFGFFAAIILIFGIFFYNYQRALKQAYEEGWDMPN